MLINPAMGLPVQAPQTETRPQAMSDFPPKSSPRYFEKPGFRWVTGVAGAVLLGLGMALLVLPSDVGWARVAVCAPLGVLGANAIHCALNATEPWIAKVGPLP